MKRKNIEFAEDDIRRKVEKKYEERGELIQHSLAYVTVNIIVWIIWLYAGAGFPWPLFVTGGWGIGMLSHLVDYYSKHGGGARRREEAIEAEVARRIELARAQESLRHLRDNEDGNFDGADVYTLDNYQPRGMRLSDDGELLDPEYDEDDQLRMQQG